MVVIDFTKLFVDVVLWIITGSCPAARLALRLQLNAMFHHTPDANSRLSQYDSFNKKAHTYQDLFIGTPMSVIVKKVARVVDDIIKEKLHFCLALKDYNSLAQYMVT